MERKDRKKTRKCGWKKKGEGEQLREKRSSWMVWRWNDGLKDDLSQCGCDTCVMKDKTSNSVQACSDLAHVVLVLVGRVTVVIVHNGLNESVEGVLVVIHTFT